MTETEEELIEKQLKVIIVGEPATGKVRYLWDLNMNPDCIAYSFINICHVK